MKLKGTLLRSAGVLGVSVLAVWGIAAARDAATIEVRPGSPSASAPARFVHASPSGTTAWLWNFGDGRISEEPSPAHVYAEPGTYTVRLKTSGASGSAESTRTVEVVNSATLRLMSNTGNPFDITLHAKDPDRSGNEGDGEAVPVNDVFGFFTIPSLVTVTPGAPFVPEVFVKMIDARALPGQDFWFFWGGLTDLVYKITVRDVNRGTVKEYQNLLHPDGQPRNNDILFADTSGFASAGVTPTPTPPPASLHVVTVGQNGASAFTDSLSGSKTTTIRVGETVQWNWMGGPHTTTSGQCTGTGGGGGTYGDAINDCSYDGKWNSGSHSSGYQFSRTFNQAGTYKYYCGVHGQSMTATVVVNAN
jgi:PKD repeat protein